jgi:hypothetical protein
MSALTPPLRASMQVLVLLLMAICCETATAAALLEGQLYERILHAATATTVAGTVTIVIDAVSPVHYAWHFPTTPSKEVIIALRMLQTPRDAAGRPDYREHIAVPPAARDVVRNMTFENNDGQDNLLTLRFNMPVTMTVSSGATAFQLRIVITQSDLDGSVGNTGPPGDRGSD